MHETGSAPVDTGGLLVGTSALFVVFGAFLGWFTVPIEGTLASIDGVTLFEVASPAFNGVVTIGLATAATLLALFLPEREGANVATAVAGVAIELVAVTFVLAPEAALGSAVDAAVDLPLSSVGVGVYVTLVGGLGILLGSVASYRR